MHRPTSSGFPGWPGKPSGPSHQDLRVPAGRNAAVTIDPAPEQPGQPELLPGMVRATVKQSQAKAKATRARKAAAATIAEVDPVARVLVDVPLAHLDRPFDYAVP